MAGVDYDGYINDTLSDVYSDNGIRPAMWISPEPIPEPPSADTQVGDHVLFGSYEQDNDASNGAEPIEWLVLDKKDGRLLVISRYALDYRPYHEKSESITWENCSLRKWLDDDFLNKAFSANERSMIRSTTIETEDSKDTKDKVFLLSTSEAEHYFDSSEVGQYEATAYAKAQGKVAYCTWWLRSPGFDTDCAAIVNYSGFINLGGDYVDINYAVRPVMWISPEPIPEPPRAETQVGEYVSFGSYEQDNDASNGKEPIEWLVLDKKNGRILVISRHVLDYRQYHKDSTTWEKCSLRKWLNDDFLNKAFSANERSVIRSKTIKTQYSKDTKDKVFLLSTSEAEQYFDSSQARQCEATAFARAQGTGTWWWLRSTGYGGYNAGSVYNDGSILDSGYLVSLRGGVRPALWINIG